MLASETSGSSLEEQDGLVKCAIKNDLTKRPGG